MLLYIKVVSVILMYLANSSYLMKVAVAEINGEVAPRVDVAQLWRVFDISPEGKVLREESVSIPVPFHPLSLVSELRRLGIDVFICGAIWGMLEHLLTFNGIRVIPWVASTVEDAIKQFVAGRLVPGYIMPGWVSTPQWLPPLRRRHRVGHCHRFGWRGRRKTTQKGRNS